MNDTGNPQRGKQDQMSQNNDDTKHFFFAAHAFLCDMFTMRRRPISCGANLVGRLDS